MMKPAILLFCMFIMLAVQNPCLAQYVSVGNYGVAPGNPDALSTYVAAVISGANSSPLISQVVSQAASINTVAKFANAALYSNYYRGFYDPQEFVVYITRPVAAKFRKLSPATIVRTFANIAGRQLLSDGILNGANAVTLAYGQVNAMEISAQNTRVNDITSQYQVLIDGLIGVLGANSGTSHDRLMSIERIMGQEIRRSARESSV